MAEQTLDLPNVTYIASNFFLRWTATIDRAIDAVFFSDGTSRNIEDLRLWGNTGQVAIRISSGNYDFTSDFEASGAMTLTASNGSELILVGITDPTEPYTWIPSNSDEVMAFYNTVAGLSDRTIDFTLNDTPPVPNIPSVSLFPITSTSVTQGFHDAEAGEECQVRYRVTGTSSWIVSSTVTTTNLTVTGLTPDTQYDIQAQCSNEFGPSGWSSTSTFTTLAQLSAPVFFDDTGNAQSWTQGAAITPVTVPAASGNPDPTYAVVGNLPSGISFSNRLITGTPSSVGSGTIRIRASNSEGFDDWTVNYTTTASGAPDLTVDTPTRNPSGNLTPGQQFTLSTVVRNGGNASSASTTLRWRRSSNSSITTSDPQEGTDGVGALSAGGASSESIALNAPNTPGTYYYGATVDTVSGESDIGNNNSGSVSVVVEAESTTAPDLTVDTPTISPAGPFMPGETFTLTTTVRNMGDANSASTTLRWRATSILPLDNSSPQVGTDAVSALSGGGSGQESILLTAIATPGTYYYGATVDPVTGESDTGNNASGAITVVVREETPAGPDLVVEIPSVNPAGNLTPGESFILSTTVRNQGDSSSASTTLRWRSSNNNIISTSDLQVGTDFVPGIGPGSFGQESIALLAPSAPGTYYYGATVDAVTGESDTGNNASGSVAVVVEAAASPFPVLTLTQTSTHNVYTWTNPDGYSLQLVCDEDNPIGPGSSYSIALNNIPTSQLMQSYDRPASQPYYALRRPSTDEFSNTVGPADNPVPGIPVVEITTPSGMEIASGSVLNLSATASGQNLTYLWEAFDFSDFFTPNLTDLGGFANNAVLNAAWTAPAVTSDSDYVIRLTVTDTGGLFASDLIGVVVNPSTTTAPDLTVDTPTISPAGPFMPGETFTLTTTVRNMGDANSASTTLRWRATSILPLDNSSPQVGTDAVSALSGGGSGQESILLTAIATPGTYYYGATVDPVTGESDTGNNASGAITVVVREETPAGPDLVVEIPSVNPAGSLMPGESFTLSTNVQNQGNASSVATTLRWRSSTNNIISTSDPAIGTDFVPGLSAGSTSQESISLLAPNTPGTYYYGATVDEITGESDIGNNASGAITVVVEAAAAVALAGDFSLGSIALAGALTVPDIALPPDLTVDTPAVSPAGNLTPGQSFTLTTFVRNQGGSDSEATTLRWRSSTNNIISTSDPAIGTDPVSALAGGGASEESFGLAAPNNPGTYYYGATVDAVDGESDTDNNASGAATVVVEAVAPELAGSLTSGSLRFAGQLQVDNIPPVPLAGDLALGSIALAGNLSVEQGVIPLSGGLSLGSVAFAGGLSVTTAPPAPLAGDLTAGSLALSGRLTVEAPPVVRLFIANSGSDDSLYEMDPDGPDSQGTRLRALPSGLTQPLSAANYNERLLIADSTGDELFEIDPDGADDEGTRLRRLPSGLTSPNGMVVYGGDRLLVADSTGDELFEIDPDGSDSQGARIRRFPSGLSTPLGMAVLGNRLLVADISALYDIDPDGSDSQGVRLRSWPSDLTFPAAMTIHYGRVLVADSSDSELFQIDPDGADSEGTRLRDLPSGLTGPQGMTTLAAPAVPEAELSGDLSLGDVSFAGDLSVTAAAPAALAGDLALGAIAFAGNLSVAAAAPVELAGDLTAGALALRGQLTVEAVPVAPVELAGDLSLGAIALTGDLTVEDVPPVPSVRTRLLVADSAGDELFEIDPDGPDSQGARLRAFPPGLTSPNGMTVLGSRLLIADSAGDELFEIDPDGADDQGTRLRAFPPGLTSPTAMTGYQDRVLIADDSGDELFEIDPDGADDQGTRLRAFPPGLSTPLGMAVLGNRLLVADISALYDIDPDGPDSQGARLRAFPSGLTGPLGMTVLGNRLLVADFEGSELFEIDPDGADDQGTRLRAFPSELTIPTGMTVLVSIVTAELAGDLSLGAIAFAGDLSVEAAAPPTLAGDLTSGALGLRGQLTVEAAPIAPAALSGDLSLGDISFAGDLSIELAGQVPAIPIVDLFNITATSAVQDFFDAEPGELCQIRYRETGTFIWTETPLFVPNFTNSTIRNLSPNTQYDIQVQCRNEFGPSGWSDTSTFTTLPSTIELSGDLTSGALNLTGRLSVFAPPSVETTAVTSIPQALPDTYGLGETIQVTITYSEPVTVDISGGVPDFRANFGNNPGAVAFPYVSGSGTAALVFEHTVAATDEDTNGIFLWGSTDAQNRGDIRLQGGTIVSTATGIAALLTTTDRGTQGEHHVNGALVPAVPEAELSGDLTAGALALQGRLTVTAAPAVSVELAGDLTAGALAFRGTLTVTAAPAVPVDLAGDLAAGALALRGQLTVTGIDSDLAGDLTSGALALRGQLTVTGLDSDLAGDLISGTLAFRGQLVVDTSLVPIPAPTPNEISPTKRFAGGEFLTHTDMNVYISDVLDDLSGDNGIVSYRDILSIAPGSGDTYFQVNARAALPGMSLPGEFYCVLSGGVVTYYYFDGLRFRRLDSDHSAVTAVNLDANGGIGTGPDQMARGSHAH